MAFSIGGRGRWTKRRVPASVKTLRRPVAIVEIHHDAVKAPTRTPAQEQQHLRDLEAFHVEKRGYAAIGYNVAVFPSGRVYVARGLDKVGAHDEKNNSRAMGIVICGNYQTQAPSAALLQTVRRTITYLANKGYVKRGAKVILHGDDGTTACPGKNLRAKRKLLIPNPWP